MTLTGSFTAQLDGNRLTDITDVTLYRDGKAFRGSGSLYALQWDAAARKWASGGYLSLDGAANNVMFIDTNYAAGDATFYNYFSSITGVGNTAFLPSYYNYKTRSTDGLDVWLENAQTGVPEPSAWALMVLGFGAVGAAIRARGRKPKGRVSAKALAM